MKKFNNKGQALVEFVLIIPIVLIVIFTSIDFSRIIYEKTRLENLTNDAIKLLEKGYDYQKISNNLKNKDKDVKIDLNYQNDGILIVIINKDINIFTPGLNLVLNNPYNIKSERVVDYE